MDKLINVSSALCYSMSSLFCKVGCPCNLPRGAKSAQEAVAAEASSIAGTASLVGQSLNGLKNCTTLSRTAGMHLEPTNDFCMKLQPYGRPLKRWRYCFCRSKSHLKAPGAAFLTRFLFSSRVRQRSVQVARGLKLDGFYNARY